MAPHLSDLAGPWRWAQGLDAGNIFPEDFWALRAWIADSKDGRSSADVAGFLKVPNASHRRVDRSLQLLKKFGLAKYGAATRRWVVTNA